MQYFTSQKLVQDIKRLTYVGNISSYVSISTASYATDGIDNDGDDLIDSSDSDLDGADLSVKCSLRPLSEIESATNGYQYGTAFNAIFEVFVDIKTNDKITIENVQYTVKGVATFNNGNLLDYKRVLIVKPQI